MTMLMSGQFVSRFVKSMKAVYEQIANYYLKPLQFFHADAEVQKKLIPLLLQLTQEYREELLEEKSVKMY